MTTSHSKSRVLIANRGEIAVRIIRACHALGMTAISMYSDVDKSALHVQMADEAHPLGGANPAESYLNIEKILSIARKCKADAIHPGYGFLSERASFAQAAEKAGIRFVGPNAKVITQMGDKTAARHLAESLKIPTLPGTTEPIQTRDAAKTHAKRIGFPLLLKAAAGGGGKGMRLVRDESHFDHCFDMATHEAKNAFGDGALLIEKFLDHPHHVEVQIIGDTHGNVVHCFERECSVQRRHQKIIEESPSPSIREKLRKELCDASVKLSKHVGYVGAGTIEYLVEDSGKWYFLEMNTRIQVEHPITEYVTGVDLVATQLQVAFGEPLPWRQKDLVQKGCAMECRIYAEDPAQNFLPSPGPITYIREPQGPFVRVDSALTTDHAVPMEYDPILSKLIVWGEDRSIAIARMQQALSEYRVGGVHTNLDLHRRLMVNADFIAGKIHTQWLDIHLASILNPLLATNAAVVAAVSLNQNSQTTTPEKTEWTMAARQEGLRS